MHGAQSSSSAVGTTLAACGRLLAALNEGRVVGLAAEGRRTRSGHLERIHLVVARLAAVADLPIIPVGIIGSFQALPPGAWFPRRHKIIIRVGTPFRLASGTTGEEAARRIGEAIAALLPPEQQPISQPQELETPEPSVLAHASGRRPRCTGSRT